MGCRFFFKGGVAGVGATAWGGIQKQARFGINGAWGARAGVGRVTRYVRLTGMLNCVAIWLAETVRARAGSVLGSALAS